ncbi:MAG: hypothetical protein CSB46_02650 [Micrococcales bacterium]|nr:MAG: hypothetical protein CSB46_02650 [Micrococcales bacterium]
MADRGIPDPLQGAVLEIEEHVARAGWDAPVRVFALIRTAEALARDPGLGDRLHPDIVQRAGSAPGYLTPVEQEDLPQAQSVEELLGRISFGPAVDGAAVSVERIVVPPDVERTLPQDPEQALPILLASPHREDVRLVVGALRTGPACCAVRQRSHDHPGMVGISPDMAPGIIEALRATLEDRDPCQPQEPR